MTEEQFDALKEWIEDIAREAVANDRPQHNRLPKTDWVKYSEETARSLLIDSE